MRFVIPPQSPVLRNSPSSCVLHGGQLFASILLASGLISAQAPALASSQSPASQTAQKPAQHSSSSPATHKVAKPAPTPEIPPPPPMPKWPANDTPSRASVTWDSHGLRIDASNSSLRQILNDVSQETGTKVEGMGSDQRVYGSYGPGQAREVISQLLQGSGYNLLLAGDLGSGAPRQIVLSPRRNGAPGSQPTADEAQQETNPDDDIPDNSEAEEPPPPPQQPVPMQPNPNAVRPGFGPNGPIRTPQQVMEEMQRQQLLQQQQQQSDQPNNQPQ
jgi:hypothetical protein